MKWTEMISGERRDQLMRLIDAQIMTHVDTHNEDIGERLLLPSATPYDIEDKERSERIWVNVRKSLNIKEKSS